MAGNGQKPVITSPQSSVSYHVHKAADGAEAINLNASADGEVKILHWFINNQYYGRSQPGESLLWHPQPGRYQVRVVDDAGRSDAANLIVSPVEIR